MAKAAPVQRRVLASLLSSSLAATGLVALAGAASAATHTLTPGQSFASALATAKPGDVIQVPAGVHPHQQIRSRTFAAPGVTLVGDSRATTTVRGLEFWTSSGITVRGMTVTGTSSADALSAIKVGHASSAITLEDLSVLPTAKSGIDITEGSHHVVVRGNTIDGSGTADSAAGRGLRLYAGTYTNPATWVHDITITGNEITRPAGDNIQAYGIRDSVISGNDIREPQQNDAHNDGIQLLGSDNVVISGNRFTAPGPSGPDQAVILSPATGATVNRTRIENNLIRDWRGSGVTLTTGTTGTDIVNNTVWSGGSDPYKAVISLTGRSPGTRVWNNIFWKPYFSNGMSRTDFAYEDFNCIYEAGTGGGPNDVYGDPQFADTTTYQLKPSSPCAQLGSPDGAPTTDVAGSTRDARPDAGAWEVAEPLGAAVPIGSAPPAASVGDASVVEGTGSATSSMTFPIMLSAPAGAPVAVPWTTAPMTATSWSDFKVVSGSVTIGVGQTTGVATVPVIADAVREADQTFAVNLSTPVNAVVGDGRGVGTIVDDDAEPMLSVDDVGVVSTTAGGNAVFTVKLSAKTEVSQTVAYTTVDGTARAGTDYTATAGTLTFPAGSTSASVWVWVKGQPLALTPRSFRLELSNPVGATLARPSATASVTYGQPPGLSADDARVGEGATGTTDAVFALRLTAPANVPVTARYTAQAGSAAAGADFEDTTGTVTFAPGETLAYVSVPVKGDAVDEANETFTLVLSGAVGAKVTRNGTATVVDDDPPALSVADASGFEGAAGAYPGVTFTVRLSSAATTTVTVAYATAGGTAVSGTDFYAKTGTVTFAPGETSKGVWVTFRGDGTVEPDERFTVNLSAPTGAAVTDGQAVGTIRNDD